MAKDKSSYLHGYSKKEQKRLYEQAEFLKSHLYQGVHLDSVARLLEVGIGVGAQTPYLFELNPQLHVTGVDISAVQLKAARSHLEEWIERGQVDLVQLSADQLSDLPGAYDGAFLCWFLEHVPAPQKVLENVRQQLKPGGVIYCTEVLNSSLFAHPYSPALLKYWFAFNDHQWEMKGNPFVGAQLGNLLLAAGFTDIQVDVRTLLCDSREPERRRQMIRHYRDVLMSAAPELLGVRKVSPSLVARMKKELTRLMRSRDSLLFDTYVRAVARAPRS